MVHHEWFINSMFDYYLIKYMYYFCPIARLSLTAIVGFKTSPNEMNSLVMESIFFASKTFFQIIRGYAKALFHSLIGLVPKWTSTLFDLFNIVFHRSSDQIVSIIIGTPHSCPFPPYLKAPIQFKLSILFRNNCIDKAHDDGFTSIPRMFIFWFP